MRVIEVVEHYGVYELNEDQEFACTHEETEVEPPCCSGIDNEGNPSCACHGQYTVMCLNYDCTGISQREADLILEGANQWED